MSNYSVLVPLGVWLLLWLPLGVIAQSSSHGPVSSQSIRSTLQKAQQLIDISRNDSALLLLQSLQVSLEKEKLADSSLVLEIQLTLGIALEHDDQDILAMSALNKVRDQSKSDEQWSTYAAACLALAELHENLARAESSKRHLESARSTIRQQQLTSLNPPLAIRIASWHQAFGYPDSVRFYSQQALQYADQFNLPVIRADAHALMGQLMHDKDYQQAIAFFQQAAHIVDELKDYRSLSDQWLNIATLYMRNGYCQEALDYCDSTINASYLAIATGHERLSNLHAAYQIQGQGYENLGKLDSAILAYKKGFSQEVIYMQQRERERVVEIDEQYKDEQKNLQIIAQARQLQSERQRLWGILSLSGIILLLSIVLAYYYRHLKRANQITIQQSNTINETNKKLSRSLVQQIILQGEIHHRVKNNLQIIINLLELQKEDITDIATRESLEAMSNRIYSMAVVHDVLYQKEGENLIDFLEYTQTICDHFSNLSLHEKPHFQLKIPELSFNLETLMPLGIILNELLTNSLKYASRQGQRILINIHLESFQNGYQLFYKDNGPGFSTGKLKDREGGLGAYLIRSMSRQLQGALETTNDNGAVYTIYFQEKNKLTT